MRIEEVHIGTLEQINIIIAARWQERLKKKEIQHYRENNLQKQFESISVFCNSVQNDLLTQKSHSSGPDNKRYCSNDLKLSKEHSSSW